MTSTIELNIKPKRGRRSKKTIDEQKEQAEINITPSGGMKQSGITENTLELAEEFTQALKNISNDSNIVLQTIELKDTLSDMDVSTKDNETLDVLIYSSSENDIMLDTNLEPDPEPIQEKQNAKKRGRKPKGGKIIQQIAPVQNDKEDKPNIILHLKCSLKDLNVTDEYNSDHFSHNGIDAYNIEPSKNDLKYELLSSENNNTMEPNNAIEPNNVYNPVFNTSPIFINQNVNNNATLQNTCEEKHREGEHTNQDTREIWRKLKILEQNLHLNNISDKKSACFWCSYDFDNPPIYIPKHFIKNSYHVYGCFCSPECATAHLMDENIDSSIKFERYYLINHIYSKIYEYNKNIKPAPNPYYMLDKYYGNLTIQEYRSLLRSERLFLIVDKPLTRILPEFHEDNDEFIINNKIIPSNNFQVKKKLQKKLPQTKNNIMNEKFGIQPTI